MTHDPTPPPAREAKVRGLTKGDARLRGLTAAFFMVLAAAVVLTMAEVGYLALKAGDQSEQNGRNLARIEQINKRLVDCTEPTGRCFIQGQKRTAEAVVGINEGTLRVIVAALSCQGEGVTGQAALSLCTVQRAESPENRTGR